MSKHANCRHCVQLEAYQMKSIIRLEAPSDLNFQVVKGFCSGHAAPLLKLSRALSASQMHCKPSW